MTVIFALFLYVFLFVCLFFGVLGIPKRTPCITLQVSLKRLTQYAAVGFHNFSSLLILRVHKPILTFLSSGF